MKVAAVMAFTGLALFLWVLAGVLAWVTGS